MRQILAAILSLVFVPLIAGADTIYFKDGMRLDVQRVWEENGVIKCDMYGSVTSYPKEDIKRIERAGSLVYDEYDEESRGL